MAMQGLLHRPHLRPLAVYLLAIAGPTLVLLYLGLQSVQRQRQAIDSLTSANARLAGEQFAAAFERDVRQLAESCLGGEPLKNFQFSGGDLALVENARRIRVFLDGVRKGHPIAGHFFVMRQNDLCFPVLDDPVALPEAAVEKRSATGADAQFAEALAQAEAMELRQNRPGAAVALYRKSFELPVPRSMKALALARIARCLRKSGDAGAAEKAYRQLAQGYDQVYDPFGRPYGLIAGFELAELELDSQESEQILEGLHHGLISGRWEISGQQIDYFLEKIRKRTNALFASNRAGSYDAYMMRVENGESQGEPVLVKTGIGNIDPIGITPAGSFYYFSFVEMSDIYAAQYDQEKGRLTSPARKMGLPKEGTNSWPQFSPDGKHLAYVRERGLCIRNLEKGDERVIPLDFRPYFPNWTSNGKAIVVAGRDNQERRAIYKVSILTTEVEPILGPSLEQHFSEGILYYRKIRLDLF